MRFLYENNNSGDWLVSHCGVKVGSLEAIMLDYLIVCSAYFRLLKILGISRLTRLSSDEINSFNANPEEGPCLLIDILKLCFHLLVRQLYNSMRGTTYLQQFAGTSRHPSKILIIRIVRNIYPLS